MQIKPDHFLETRYGRLWTVERNMVAWQQCFIALENELKNNNTSPFIYVLIGCQAGGKSTWAKQHLLKHPDDIVFDAILVKKSERKPILKLAKTYNKVCIAVFFTPLELCIQRNSQRPQDQMVHEQALRNVYHALEPPCLSEGFENMIQYSSKL